METGMNPTQDILDPAPINCRTCHEIHTTYTAADYALTATTPVTLINSGAEVDFGAAAGNLCAQCHQGRALNPVPVIDGADVTLTSSRYGVHHGPQGQVIAGEDAFEFAGSQTITGGPNSHGPSTVNEGSCATCHMGQAFGEQAGGHTWKMTYEYHGADQENIAGCVGCHSTLTTFDFRGIRTTVLGLLTDIETELVAQGIKAAMSADYTADGLDVYAVPNDTDPLTPAPETWPANLAAAFANWQMFAEDRSLGVHNPVYALAVLTNTLEAITP
jgi:hypothetical protein